MLTAALLLAVLFTPRVGPIEEEDAMQFAWGDVFALDAPTLGDHVAFGLGIEAVGADLELVGEPGPAGRRVRLSGGGARPVNLLVAAESPASLGEALRVQTLVVVENDAAGRGRWDAAAGILHVVRPARAPLGPEVYGALLERLVAEPERDGESVPRHVIAYGLSRSDVRPRTWIDADGRPRAWVVTGVGHRARRVVLDLDLDDPTRASRFVASFEPRGVAGLNLSVRDDDAYDRPGLDLGRASATFEFDSAVAAHGWVGGALDLRAGEQPRDLGRPGVELHLSVAGHVDGGLRGAANLFFALVDDDGREAHVPADLDEITTYEQEVALPLARFTAAEPSLDLARLVALRVGVRDEESGRSSAGSGSIALLDPRFVVDSPTRLSPLNTFWSNEPARHASADHALSDRFLGQPVTAYKYFHGVGGADPADTAAILANVTAIRAAGVTPHVTLELWPNTEERVPTRVLAGDYDPFFRTLFGGLAEIGGRVELAPFHEGNAWWYPWSAKSDPSELRAVFRRVGELRDEARAHNVALGYVVICLPSEPSTLANAVAAFPGDDVVDFVGLQGFESGYVADSVTFNELFTASGAVLRRVTDLPFAVTEYGFSPKKGAQHAKGDLVRRSLRDAAAGRTAVPLANLMYFNVAKTENDAWRDWRIFDEAGAPVPEIEAVLPEVLELAERRELRTAGLGRDAYERRLRAHSRVALRLE